MANKGRKAALWMAAILIVALAGVQAFSPERTNPPSDPAVTLSATSSLTPEAAAIIDRACRDCHSNETRWPAYSRVVPFSWLVVDHVNDGRRHLNFSKWGQYDAEDAREYLTDMCALARERDMPLPSYLWLHPEARLSDADIAALCTWSEAERRRLAAE